MAKTELKTKKKVDVDIDTYLYATDQRPTQEPEVKFYTAAELLEYADAVGLEESKGESETD